MTGVAGKSKGCATCRRRKIKCDLKTPACQNCTRFDRICEGYERYPIFINRTPKGVVRRKPLEEAKSSPSGARSVNIRVDRAPELRTWAYSPSLQLCSRNAETSRCVSWFLDSSMPTGSPMGPGKKRPLDWLHYVITLMFNQPALDEALLAVSLTKYGRVHRDTAVLEESRRIYARALGLLQQLLYNEQSALLDETLATVSIMVMYEIIETTSTSPEGWSRHVRGFTSLLKHRGPQRHRALLPRKMFEHSRYILMMQALTQRKASILAEKEWLEEPWADADKSVEQRIFDYGLRLGGLLETADTLLKSKSRFDDAAKLSGQLAEICTGVHYLRGPSAPSEMKSRDSQAGKPPESPAGFSTKVIALGIKLIACVTGHAVALKAAEIDHAAAAAITYTANTSEADLRPGSVQIAKEWFNSRRISLAREICRMSISFLGKGVGDARGVGRVIFPLRVAFEQLETTDAEYVGCRALLQRLEGKGKEYVPALNRNEAIASQIIRHRSPLTKSRSIDG